MPEKKKTTKCKLDNQINTSIEKVIWIVIMKTMCVVVWEKCIKVKLLFSRYGPIKVIWAYNDALGVFIDFVIE